MKATAVPLITPLFAFKLLVHSDLHPIEVRPSLRNSCKSHHLPFRTRPTGSYEPQIVAVTHAHGATPAGTKPRAGVRPDPDPGPTKRLTGLGLPAKFPFSLTRRCLLQT